MKWTRRQSFGGILGMLLAPFAPQLIPAPARKLILFDTTHTMSSFTPLQQHCTVESIRQLGDFMSQSIDRQSAAMSGSGRKIV